MNSVSFHILIFCLKFRENNAKLSLINIIILMIVIITAKLVFIDAIINALSALVFVEKILIIAECIKQIHIEIKRIIYLSLIKVKKRF
jgi:hypothetical protein